jgi:hypothetical protein
MGLNGILVAFDTKLYGTARINLFQGSLQAVHELLSDFIKYRNVNAEAIFEATVRHMKAHSYKAGPPDFPKTKEDTKKEEVYALFVQLMTACTKTSRDSRGDESTFSQIGLGLRSFCQTWDVKTGAPKFSVAAPHFQTRVYVRNSETFKTFIRNTFTAPNEFAEAYFHTVSRLCQAFITNKYKGAFVDLDGTLESMNKNVLHLD